MPPAERVPEVAPAPALDDPGRVAWRHPLEAPPARGAAAQAPAEEARPARIFGRLTQADDGRPLGGIELGVSAAGIVQRARTALDGSFAFELAPGPGRFFGAPPERVPFVAELELAAGEERDLSRALGAAQPLCVRVWTREHGRVVPVRDAAVFLIGGQSTTLAHVGWPEELALEPVRTDGEGRAELACEPLAQHVLFVAKEGLLPYVAALDFSPFLSWLPFSPDGCVHLQLVRAAGLVRGRVTRADGRPLAGTLVGLTDGEQPAYALHELGAPPPDIDPRHEPMLVPSLHPPFVLSDADGRFTLSVAETLAARGAATLIACPGRAELVHHVTRRLEADALRGGRALALVVPDAGEVELEFVDEHGTPRDGIASVREPDGFAHGRPGELTPFALDPRSAGRQLPTQAGRLRLRHPGGRVRVGLSPEGVWDEREFELELPPGGELRRLRVLVPR